MRILVTRPQPDADSTARLLRALGHDALVAPLLQIFPNDLPETIDLADVQAVLITSANGLRALAKAIPDRGVQILTVGAASAAAARDAGFEHVDSAGGDVTSLAALVRETLDPGAGTLLHAAGSVTAGDLSGDLTKSGFQVEKIALYRAETLKILPETVKTALENREIDGVALYSPRSAKVFVKLVAQAGISRALRTVNAYCLSAAVAEALKAGNFADVHVSYTLDQQGILDMIGVHP